MTDMLAQEACTGCETAAQCPYLCPAPWTPPSICHTAPPPPSHRLNMAIWQLRAATEQAFPAVLARLWHIHHRAAVLQLQARAAGHLTPCWRLRMCAIAAQSVLAHRQPSRQATAMGGVRTGLALADSASQLALLQRAQRSGQATLQTTLQTRTSWQWQPSSSMKTLAS